MRFYTMKNCPRWLVRLESNPLLTPMTFLLGMDQESGETLSKMTEILLVFRPGRIAFLGSGVLRIEDLIANGLRLLVWRRVWKTVYFLLCLLRNLVPQPPT